jgi:hypothetical protein
VTIVKGSWVRHRPAVEYPHERNISPVPPPMLVEELNKATGMATCSDADGKPVGVFPVFELVTFDPVVEAHAMKARSEAKVPPEPEPKQDIEKQKPSLSPFKR